MSQIWASLASIEFWQLHCLTAFWIVVIHLAWIFSGLRTGLLRSILRCSWDFANGLTYDIIFAKRGSWSVLDLFLICQYVSLLGSFLIDVNLDITWFPSYILLFIIYSLGPGFWGIYLRIDSRQLGTRNRILTILRQRNELTWLFIYDLAATRSISHNNQAHKRWLLPIFYFPWVWKRTWLKSSTAVVSGLGKTRSPVKVNSSGLAAMLWEQVEFQTSSGC
jgi:hypothetical protein